LAVELLGDRWSLVILRDVIFGGRRSYGSLFSESDEGISSNILVSRLKFLEANELLIRISDPNHSQKSIYSLTEKSITLIPALIHIGAWGRRWLETTPKYAVRMEMLERGGPELWARLMDELRAEHLGRARPDAGPSVVDTLRAAFDATAAAKSEP